MNATISKLQKNNISVYIDWLVSENGNEFPNLGFSADTDMATNGLGSLTSIEKTEIVIAEFSTDEWTRGVIKSDSKNFWIEANIDFENRINAMMGRTDLRSIWNITWQPQALFRDIYSLEGRSKIIIKHQKIEVFFGEGGELLDVL